MPVYPDLADSNHLYVAFADQGTNAKDRAAIFFAYSTNGGGSGITNSAGGNLDAQSAQRG